MKNHILQIGKKLKSTKKLLLHDSILQNDIDFSYDFILPYSKADSFSNIKLVIIGQDPTIQSNKESSKKRQRKITITLDLNNKNGNLRKYCKLICENLDIDIDNEVYATNLCKCVFKGKPAYNGVLDKHSKYWIPLLKKELSVFSDKVIFITLGEPLIRQLIFHSSKKVNYYWDYIKETRESGGDFKCNQPFENFIQKRIYPIAHQPTWNRINFYKTYLSDYLEYIKRNEKQSTKA
ncbi:MAG: hypothetical protein GXO79_09315 [Chlorobi bacterium]|nr:hypothetical protein [Chlorobiota bacterium]